MKQPEKTLIVLTPGFAANEADTTCLPAQQIFIKAINKNFINIKIIIIAFQYPFISSTYQWNGNTIIPLNGKNKSKLSRLIVWFNAWKNLKKINKEDNVIGLLSFWCTECAFVANYFAKKNSLKHYSWILGQDAREKNKFIKWTKPNGENLIAMSDFLAAEFYKNYKIKPVYVIPNGIDPSLYNFANSERNIDVLGAGSLIPLKQYDVFITVVKELQIRIPRIHAVLCGKGPEEKKINNIINEMNLQNNITLTGEKSHPEILQMMSKSKIFLHTSSYEGFSTVCLEALYAGAHVISFCKPMNASIKNWHIVNDKNEMIEVALSILLNPVIKYEPVLFYAMDDSAKKMMHLFSDNNIIS